MVYFWGVILVYFWGVVFKQKFPKAKIKGYLVIAKVN